MSTLTIEALEDIIAGLKKPKREKQDVYTNDGKPIKKTLYLPDSVHQVFYRVASALRISQQEIFRQALDLWLADNDLPSWAEIVEDAAKERAKEKKG